MGKKRQAFTLADLVDYEGQITLLNAASAPVIPKLDAATLQLGKIASLRAWLERVRGSFGEHFAQLRLLLLVGLIVIGALLGWGTIRVLLHIDGQTPVNVLFFLAIFVLIPLLFFVVLAFKDLMLRFLGKLSAGWFNLLINKIIEWVLRRGEQEYPALEAWRRIKTLHPQVFALQAWGLSQLFALSYYIAAAAAFLFMVTVNDYTFSWQTTLKIGPEAFAELIHLIAWPFAWLYPQVVPSMELIESTQYDRFLQSYVNPNGNAMAGFWWPFLLTLILVYGVLPRLLLASLLYLRLHLHLRHMKFNDFASENLWLRLQKAGVSWEASHGTEPGPALPLLESVSLQPEAPLLLIRWRQAPFRDEDLRQYFQERGYTVSQIIDAEGRESEVRSIVDSLKKGQALALASEPWELPGEAFNQLRLAIRRAHSNRMLMLFAPLENSPQGLAEPKDEQTIKLWQSGVKAFKDPYVGLLDKRI